MDRSRYHADWEWVSRQIRDQADGRCEWCGVANGAVGARDREGAWHDEADIEGMSGSVGDALFGDYPKIIRIVLTCAHLCHDTSCIDPTHLRSLCQRDHLNLDRPNHIANAAITRARKRREAVAATGQQELFA